MKCLVYFSKRYKMALEDFEKKFFSCFIEGIENL